jgi:hypothetical protein
MARVTIDREELAAVVARMKREVVADIRRGVVPASVRTFAELHDCVDANGYGGAFEAWWEGCCGDDAFCAFWNAAQGAVDHWLRKGGHRAKLAECGR